MGVVTRSLSPKMAAALDVLTEEPQTLPELRQALGRPQSDASAIRHSVMAALVRRGYADWGVQAASRRWGWIVTETGRAVRECRA